MRWSLVNLSYEVVVKKIIFNYVFEKYLYVVNGIIGTWSYTLPYRLMSNNSSTLSVSEAYKILNLDITKKPTKEIVNKAYLKIQKKIHPDVSPETARLSTIVNEAKEIVLQDIS